MVKLNMNIKGFLPVLITIVSFLISKPLLYIISVISLISLGIHIALGEIEFQMSVINLLMRISFSISLIVLFLSLPFYVKKEKYKKILWFIASPVIVFEMLGILIILLKGGVFYIDKSILINQDDGNFIIYEQYCDDGGLGGHSRYIKIREIIPGVRAIYELSENEVEGKWDIYELDGTFRMKREIPSRVIYMEGEIIVKPRSSP